MLAVGQSVPPSGLHHANEEEKPRWGANTEAPSAPQSHLFDWEEGGRRERERESGGRRIEARSGGGREGGRDGEGGRCCLEKGRE